MGIDLAYLSEFKKLLRYVTYELLYIGLRFIFCVSKELNEPNCHLKSNMMRDVAYFACLFVVAITNASSTLL